MSSEPVRILCFGSSITQSNGVAEIHRWPTRVQCALQAHAPGRFELYNKGIGGNTTAQALDRIQTDIIPLLPAHVIIGFGANDASIPMHRLTSRVGLAEYESNTREIIRIVEAGNGTPILFNYHLPAIPKDEKGNVIPNQGNGRPLAENMAPYHEAVKKIASERNLPLISIPDIMQKHNVRIEELVGPDHIHNTIAGNHFYATHITEFLLQHFQLTRDR